MNSVLRLQRPSSTDLFERRHEVLSIDVSLKTVIDQDSAIHEHAQQSKVSGEAAYPLETTTKPRITK